jgi:hypothetical protein
MTRVNDIMGPEQRPDDSHGNRRHDRHRRDSERFPLMSVRRIPVDSTPYGSSISRNGKTLWGGFHSDRLVAVGATSGEARARYIAWHLEQMRPREQ